MGFYCNGTLNNATMLAFFELFMGEKSIVMQISIVTLIFLLCSDKILRSGKSF